LNLIYLLKVDIIYFLKWEIKEKIKIKIDN